MNTSFTIDTRPIYFALVSAANVIVILLAAEVMRFPTLIWADYVLLATLAAFPVSLVANYARQGTHVFLCRLDMFVAVLVVCSAIANLIWGGDFMFLMSLLVLVMIPLAKHKYSLSLRPFRKIYLIGYIGLPVFVLWTGLVMGGQLEPLPVIMLPGGLEYAAAFIASVIGFSLLVIKREELKNSENTGRFISKRQKEDKAVGCQG